MFLDSIYGSQEYQRGAQPICSTSSEYSLNLHVVEELFVHDLAVGDLVDTHFFHGEPLGLRFKRDVELERNGEMRAGDERALDLRGVNLVIRHPPFAFRLDRLNTFRFARLSGRSSGFDADDVRGVKGFYGLLELAF